ncbi:hypothetical protein BGC_20480 [Burkholderia sp. 3C]
MGVDPEAGRHWPAPRPRAAVRDDARCPETKHRMRIKNGGIKEKMWNRPRTGTQRAQRTDNPPLASGEPATARHRSDL